MRYQTPIGIHTPSGSEWATVAADGYALHVDLSEGDAPTLAESVSRTLRDDPPWLHCRWLYDEVGSELYERITEQPEYYLTGVEDRILADNADALLDLVDDATIVELGSGSSTKTRRLLEAWLKRGETRYVPIDISRAALEQACSGLADAYPRLMIEGLAARYARGLPLVGEVSPLLLLFLGSTIGNFNELQLAEFLELVAASLSPGDHFLLGVDLVKDPQVLNDAYNDAAGWTERFMVNIVARMNRELGTGVPLDGVAYEGTYNERRERVEMFLRFTDDVHIDLADGSAPVRIAAGDRVLVEISTKFRLDRLVPTLRDFGFYLERCFSDPDDMFAVLLLTRRD